MRIFKVLLPIVLVLSSTVQIAASVKQNLLSDKVADWDEKTTLRATLREQASIDFKDEEYKTIILEYIDMVLEDGILNDPKEYLKAWYEERGLTREMRMPEDYALSFFAKYLYFK